MGVALVAGLGDGLEGAVTTFDESGLFANASAFVVPEPLIRLSTFFSAATLLIVSGASLLPAVSGAVVGLMSS